jgi:hypoxanthine phosphoribosyltransferase
MTVEQCIRLLSEERIRDNVGLIADQINAEWEGKDPVLLCVLNGGFMFFADLTRQLTIPHQVDFIRIACYGDSPAPEQPRWVMGPSMELKGRHILVVDDIIDTGETAHFIEQGLGLLHPQSIHFVVLLSKMARRKRSVVATYIGFDIGDHFVFGYGLDLKGRYRTMRDIYRVGSE